MNSSSTKLTVVLTGLLLLGCTNSLRKKAPAEPAGGESPERETVFAEYIRQTEPLSAEQERATFRLPPGFQISLYAAEPNIGKPTNLAFDAKGRLWVAHSVEYPFAAKPGQGHDRVTMLEDANQDGKADKFTDVADSLNIPIGVLPGAQGAVVFSIPNVYRFTDANQDGKPESGQRLLGPFGFKDTHGMVNHLTRGYDGWIHACHGFSNTSRVAGADGDSVVMNSGNTFRFRADGSRVEQTTFGRVNPFGLVYDDWGYLYSTDCHTSPLYQLIRGASYPHFGKPETGIGFAPVMKSMDAEATALAGIVLPSSRLLPEGFENAFYVGDVARSRIYRNSYQWQGSSPVAKLEGDLLRTSDPWFRPVDLLEGPDGALYVADFYNRIIGHYEVALDHPGRDRLRGRIWRITYKGQTHPQGRTDWTKAPINELIGALKTGNLPIRMLATDQLVNRVGQPAVEELQLTAARKQTTPTQLVHCLWALHQLAALPDALLNSALNHPEALVRTHALRMVQESPVRNAQRNSLITNALADKSPHVQRAAVEALVGYPTLENVKRVLAFVATIPVADTHLSHTAQLTLQTFLSTDGLSKAVAAAKWSPTEQRQLVLPMSGVNAAHAAQFLLHTLTARTTDSARTDKKTDLRLLLHIGRYLPKEQQPALVDVILAAYPGDVDTQVVLLKAVRQGIQQQGIEPHEAVKNWVASLANTLLQLPSTAWQSEVDGVRTPKTTPLQLKPQTGGVPSVGFGAATARGIVRSPAFDAPATLAFTAWTWSLIPAGKEALPLVRLVLSDGSQTVLAEEPVPVLPEFKTKATPVRWDLAAHAGKRVCLEVVDPSAVTAVFVGNFEGVPNAFLPVASPDKTEEQKLFGIELAGDLALPSAEGLLRQTLQTNHTTHGLLVAAAEALLKIAPQRYAPVLGQAIADEHTEASLRVTYARLLGNRPTPETQRVMETALKHTTGEVQLELLKSLASTSDGKDLILNQVFQGTLYARALVQPGLEERLLLNSSAKQKQRFDQLTARLPAIDPERDQVIERRLSAFLTNPGDSRKGREVFIVTCSTCHQIGKNGGLIGPQLDGIGGWGSRALATKILDPNRNISEAFRNYTVKLKSGEVKTGLLRHEDDKALVYADAAGKEFVVPRQSIDQIQASRHTLMPDQFSTLLSEADFNDLLSYLLSVK